MQFSYHKFDLKEFNLYPLGDWHVGSPQCNKGFIKRHIVTVTEDPLGYWVGMSDFMENAIVGSKSDLYKQTMSPEEQLDWVCETLEPIQDKGLFIIAANHEQRTMKTVGLQPERHIAKRLDVPYKGYSCYAIFQLMQAKNPQSFKCYFHHNYGGGYTKGGKVNRSAKLREIAPSADATFSAHFHITSRTPSKWYDTGRKGIISRVGYDYIIGSALEYDESYAEERAKPAAVTEFIRVTFKGCTNGRRDNREQIYEVITSNGRQ